MVSYGLHNTCEYDDWTVLILIVVDNGLVHIINRLKQEIMEVLILIVVDNGLVRDLIILYWLSVS